MGILDDIKDAVVGKTEAEEVVEAEVTEKKPAKKGKKEAVEAPVKVSGVKVSGIK